MWQDGNLVHPNGASVAQARAHTRCVKHLFGYLYRHVADLRLQEMMFLQAQSDGRVAYLVLDQACRRDITDLELTRLNQDFDNSSIEADVGITSDSITLFGRHLNGVNARRPENMRKNDNDLTLRLLYSINGNLNSSMHLDALKEICAAPHKRDYQDAVTGMTSRTRSRS